MMLPAWLAALVVGYLPGALVFRLPWWNRDRRAALAAEERAFWAVVLSAAWSLAVVLVLASIGRYTFERLILIDLSVCALALLAGRTKLRLGSDAPRPGWSALVPVALVAGGLWLYFPSSEYVIGGKDPGTYINEGVQIAQRGTFIYRDPVVASVPAPVRDIFFPPYRDQLRWYYSLRFQGFWIDDPERGDVIGQFPHLFPASIAVGYGLNGLSGARQAVGVWAILGVLAVYFAAARLFGTVAGAGAAALLAINVIQVWFARYPSTEIPMQALLFAGVLAFGRASEGSRVFFGAIAAALVAGMLFLRIDALLAIATCVAASVLLPVVGRRIGMTFWIVLAAIGGVGYAYWMGPMDGYAARVVDYINEQGGVVLIAAAALAAALAARLSRIDRVARPIERVLPPVIAVVIVMLAVYAYFFRHEGGRLAYHDAIAFRTLGWYLTPLGLGLAVAGAAWVIWRHFWTAPALLLMICTYTAFFAYKTRVVPEHFWSARRFLAAAIPGGVLLIAGFASDLSALATRRLGRSRAIACVALVAAALSPVAWLFWTQTAPIRSHVEYAGIIPELERLAAQIGDTDLVLVESRDAGSDLHTLALPLADIYARNVLVLSSAAPDKQALDTFIMWASGRYTNVFFLGGGGTDLLTRHLTATPVSSGQFRVPEYASVVNAYPTGVRRKDFEYGLYKLTTDASPAAAPATVQVGGHDDVQVARFHARERTGDTGVPFRWTTGQSIVVMPRMPDDARTLVISMGAGGRPPEAPQAEVEVMVGDRVVGSVVAAGAIAPYSFALPADLVQTLARAGEPFRIRLRVVTWRPQAIVGGTDDRDLGVMVTQVEIR